MILLLRICLCVAALVALRASGFFSSLRFFRIFTDDSTYPDDESNKLTPSDFQDGVVFLSVTPLLGPLFLEKGLSIVMNSTASELYNDDYVLAVSSHRRLKELAPEVVQKAHEDNLGCGGFFVHKTLEEAKEWASKRRLQALFNAPTGPGAGDKKLPLAEELSAKLKASDLIDFIREYTTTFTTRYSRENAGLEASKWLARRWSKYVEDISYANVEEVPVEGYSQSNVVMTLTGRNAEKIILLGAHMDSTEGINKPAADDNASGSSAVNALAQLALDTKMQPQNTIIFVLYAAEETGLNGSKQMAQEFQSSQKNVLATLNFDMIGASRNKEADIAWMSPDIDTELTRWLSSLVTLYYPDLTQTQRSTPGGSSSDHASWHKSGFSASFLTEGGGNWEVYHGPGDKWNLLDGEHIANIARVGALFFVHMAMAEAATTTTTTTPIPSTAPIPSAAITATIGSIDGAEGITSGSSNATGEKEKDTESSKTMLSGFASIYKLVGFAALVIIGAAVILFAFWRKEAEKKKALAAWAGIPDLEAGLPGRRGTRRRTASRKKAPKRTGFKPRK